MNNPVCLHCNKVFNGSEFMMNTQIGILNWTKIQCPYCGKIQEYSIEFDVKICYRKVRDEDEKI